MQYVFAVLSLVVLASWATFFLSVALDLFMDRVWLRGVMSLSFIVGAVSAFVLLAAAPY